MTFDKTAPALPLFIAELLTGCDFDVRTDHLLKVGLSFPGLGNSIYTNYQKKNNPNFQILCMLADVWRLKQQIWGLCLTAPHPLKADITCLSPTAAAICGEDLACQTPFCFSCCELLASNDLHGEKRNTGQSNNSKNSWYKWWDDLDLCQSVMVLHHFATQKSAQSLHSWLGELFEAVETTAELVLRLRPWRQLPPAPHGTANTWGRCSNLPAGHEQ